MTTTNELFRAARERLGLSEAEVAGRAGLSLAEYCDLEQHENEAFTVVHLDKLRLLADVLQLDILDVFGIACAYCAEAVSRRTPHTRNESVRTRRLELGWSEEGLGDRIGFDTSTVKDIEKDPDYLDRWSLELVLELADTLRLPPHILLNVECRKCGLR